MRNLKDRVAVVTGGASGIGRATSILLAGEGCDVAISDVNEEGLLETAAEIEALGRKVSSKILDVSDREAMEVYPEQVLSEHGHVHVVFNNAGVAANDLFVGGDLADLEWVMGINFWGVVYGTKYFLPHLLEQDEGHLVNMSSIFGLGGVPAQSSYCSAKFAVRGFTEAVRAEHLDSNVHFSLVMPGGVATNIAVNARYRRGFDGRTHEEGIERFAELARTTPEKAATTIVRGIKRNKARILVGMDARFLDKLIRVMPVGYQWLADKLFYRDRPE
jgi:NAD(P)-dependent dehydrogenase (short-subunit alcohol dehydrogenase family)